MNLTSLVLLASGGVLIYSAVKGKDPREVVRGALTGKTTSAVGAKYRSGSGTGTPPAEGPMPTTDPIPGTVSV